MRTQLVFISKNYKTKIIKIKMSSTSFKLITKY